MSLEVTKRTSRTPLFSGLLSKLVLCLLMVGFVAPAVAHNVVAGAYADGMTIEGEIGFSNGDMAEAGVVVVVFNEAGDKLGEAVVQEGGVFSYQAKAVQKHILRADLSSGHIAEMVVEADDLSADDDTASSAAAPASKSDNQATQGNRPANVAGSAGVAVGVTPAELKSMVRSAVAQQVRPLQKELRSYKEKVMFRDIAGGLGFIFGLFGVAAWVASKRQDKKG
ncbi:MAG: cobalt ABC transporter permease [Proteobacteria bacterium]|nr:MAG: cobalt ABC transporter permease [Pseudomonadota bacterium]